MNSATRFTIIAGCVVLCGGGITKVCSSCHKPTNIANHSQTFAAVNWFGGYRFAADTPEFDLKRIETTIILHDTIKSGCNRIEFGSVQVEHATAQVEVFYFSADQRMLPFLYKLVSENDSWKIVSVERMWSVSRSRVVRGLRV